MKKSRFNHVEMSEVDWDLMRFYKLGSMNLVLVRHFLKDLLNGYLNGCTILLKKDIADSIFRFLQQTEFGYVNANKKSKVCRTRQEARK